MVTICPSVSTRKPEPLDVFPPRRPDPPDRSVMVSSTTAGLAFSKSEVTCSSSNRAVDYGPSPLRESVIISPRAKPSNAPMVTSPANRKRLIAALDRDRVWMVLWYSENTEKGLPFPSVPAATDRRRFS